MSTVVSENKNRKTAKRLRVRLCHVQSGGAVLIAKASRLVSDSKIKLLLVLQSRTVSAQHLREKLRTVSCRLPAHVDTSPSWLSTRNHLLWIVGCVWLAINLFVPYVNGIMLWYLRPHVDFVKSPYADPPQGGTCFLTTLNRQAKEKYKFNLQQNQKWAESRGWKYVEFLQEDHNERLAAGGSNGGGSNGSTNVMFLKYHGIEFLFQHEECELVIYVDADAVVLPEQAHQRLPLSSEKDVVFGNELFVFAMRRVESFKAHHGVLNAGFILIRKTDFSQQFVRNVLRHHRCDGCRDKFCFDFSAGYDQGCIDNLLSHEYRDQLHHFGVGRVQAPVARTKQLAYNPGSLLFCHPAGLVKTFYDDPCNLFANDDGLHVRRRRKT